MEKFLAIIFLVLVQRISLAVAQDETTDENDLRNTSYCFEFTWLGPNYNYESDLSNVTCKSLLNDSKGIPCVKPLKATNDSKVPNTYQLWEQNKKNPLQIACRQSDINVCVKYSYIYNSRVENITYMCSKVNIVGEGTVTNGCFTQYFSNGRQIEVCACQSKPGLTPCNNANRMNSMMIRIMQFKWIFIFTIFLIYKIL